MKLLAVVLGLLIGTTLPPVARAEVVATNVFRPFSFLWISDPHFSIRKVLAGSYNSCQLREAFRDAADFPYDFTLCTGDLFNDGPGATQLRMGLAMFQFSKGPVYSVPGNHDVGNQPYKDPKGREPHDLLTPELLRRYRENMGADHYVFVHNNCAFIGLNSSLFNTGLPEEAEQWAFLERELARGEAEKRTHLFIFMHYAVGANGPSTFGKEMPGLAYYEVQPPARERLVALVAKHKVRAVLSGHFHRFFDWEQKLEGGHSVHLIVAPSMAFRRPEVGCLRARVDEKGIQVERRWISPLHEGGFGRAWNAACPPEETNAAEFKKMAASGKFRALDAPPSEADLARLTREGPDATSEWRAAALPLASGATGWTEGNIGADKDLLLAFPFRYSPKENGMVTLDLVSNNALEVWLNGKRVYRLGEAIIQDEGKDHHLLNRLALDPIDFANGPNCLVIWLRKPVKISSMALMVGLESQKNYDKPVAKKPAKP